MQTFFKAPNMGPYLAVGNRNFRVQTALREGISYA